MGARRATATEGRRRVDGQRRATSTIAAGRSPPPRFAALFDVAGVDWYSLQRDEDEGAMRDVPAAAALVRLPLRNDFDGTAALVAELDLVVSVDTSIAHLAGALARPVWVLLPYAPDWRWQHGRTDSPWYPTARLFRQRTRGDWDGVIASVHAALASLAATG